MSKYEQCSAWDAFPLRKAQLHYAAMDSFILVKIYEILKKTHEFDEIMYSDNDVLKPALLAEEHSERNSSLFED